LSASAELLVYNAYHTTYVGRMAPVPLIGYISISVSCTTIAGSHCPYPWGTAILSWLGYIHT